VKVISAEVNLHCRRCYTQGTRVKFFGNQSYYEEVGEYSRFVALRDDRKPEQVMRET